MTKSAALLKLYLVLLVVSPVCPQESAFKNQVGTALQAYLDKVVIDEKVPGMTLAIQFEDGTLIDLASGYENAHSKSKMAVGSRMFCGSTGKTIVSAIALQLIGEGKFGLDDKVASFFENTQDREWYFELPNANEMTIRSLLNHTSGLPRYLFQPEYQRDLKAHPLKDRSPKSGLKALSGTKPIHGVGKGWSYSDSNYLLLGLVIEKVAGDKFYELAKQRILKKLSLNDTIPATQPKLPGLIQGHIGSVNLFGLPKQTVNENGEYALNPAFEWCGGGFITNVSDMARFLHALHTGKVVPHSLYKKLTQPVGFIDGQPAEQGYGLGTFVWKTQNGIFLGHAGIMPGYLTQIEHSVKYKFTIALQTNTDQGLGQQMHKVVQGFAAKSIELISEATFPDEEK